MKIQFGENVEYLYESSLTEAERAASWYTAQQMQAMRIHAYGIAKTGAIVGDCEKLLHGHCLRGLEKLLPAKKDKSKRRRNIVRSLVELHRMCDENAPDNAEIVKTLKTYVAKHNGLASQAARERGINDQSVVQEHYLDVLAGLVKCKDSINFSQTCLNDVNTACSATTGAAASA